MQKRSLRLVFAGLCMLGLVTKPVFALAATNDEVANEELVKKITERTQLLEDEVKELRQELKTLKQQQKKPVTVTAVSSTKATKDATSTANQSSATVVTVQNNDGSSAPHLLFHSNPFIPVGDLTSESALLYFGGTPVVISPYLGVRSAFNASDLIVNISSINEDLRLLQQWYSIENAYRKYNEPIPQRPFVDLSGKVEMQAIATRPYTGGHTSQITLSGAELDVLAQVSAFARGFLAFKYDNNQTSPQITSSSNTNVFLDKGFITIGDLDVVPIYATAGQAYVPFGLYSSNMISAPLTQSVFRTKAQYLQLGYAQPDGRNLYGAIYAFNGDTSTTSEQRINQGGINIGFKGGTDLASFDIGAGLIANVADSDGMQSNGATSGFTGFAQSSSTEQISHQVPGADFRAAFGYRAFSFTSEFITGTKGFNGDNLSYDGHGAKPSALNLEGSYSFEMWHRPAAVSLGWQETKEALVLLVPTRRYIAAFNTSIWKSTIASLEYRHDINYGTHAFAAGQGSSVVTTNTLGRTDDMVTAQFGVYF